MTRAAADRTAACAAVRFVPALALSLSTALVTLLTMTATWATGMTIDLPATLDVVATTPADPHERVSGSSEREPVDDTGDRTPRLMSINLCADQLLLEYAPAHQIVALSNLAIDADASRRVARAVRFPITDGGAEAAIARAPDLVVAGEFSPRHTIASMRAAGLRVEILPLPRSLDAVFDNIESIHRWLDRPAAGRAATARLRARLQRLATHTARASDASAPGVLTLDANGFTVGEDTLDHELITRAGWHNLAVDAGVKQYGKLPIETIVRLAPSVLIESPYRAGTFSRGQALVSHPALRARGLASERIVLPSADTICGGPWSVALVEQLDAARRALGEP